MRQSNLHKQLWLKTRQPTQKYTAKRDVPGTTENNQSKTLTCNMHMVH